MMTRIKTSAEIAAMREGGCMLATVLKTLEGHVLPGVSTKELADIAKRELRALGGQPTILGYQGFPDVICVSVNDEVVHGIPSPRRILREGDIVGLDFCVTYKGMITDSAITVITGTTDENKTKELVADTQRALMAGISAVRGDVHVGDIGAAVEGFLHKKRYGIVRDLVGHGVGHEMHEDPNVPNYGRAGRGPLLKTGMTIAIEPMVTLGGYEVFIDTDGWTIRTRDGSIAAHFEHTVLVTNEGAEILTTF